MRATSRVLAVWVIAGLALAGCAKRGGEGPGFGRDSGPGGGRDSGDPPGNDGGGLPGDCSSEARWIYVVTDSHELLRFQPDALSFTSIGTLSCPSGGTTPFSMAIDRDARAWVLFQDNRIYHVSTTDASCSPSAFAPNQMSFQLFGMGFASDAEGSSEETLYIGGGLSLSVGSGSSNLGSIDEGSLAVSTVGNLPGWPELTGTGAGELWGFFPDTTPMSIRQIDKTTGATPVTFPLDALGTEMARAWAFAFWGGRFYVFLQRASDSSTKVWRVDPRDGVPDEVVPDSGYRIVGAGVSTCAPIELI